MAIERLLEIMARLRDPARGCPWDLQQDFRSIAPHTLEEAYEVADAIEQGDLAKLRDELGDLLFQVAFHAQLASEGNAFAFDDVVGAICDKLTRRHPHVFGDAVIANAAEQSAAWERMKREERAVRGDGGALADVPMALPALTRARKLGARAAQAGFDWPDAAGPRAKVDEELAELDVDPESALRRANERFARRYRYVERELDRLGQRPGSATPELLDRIWASAKSENP